MISWVSGVISWANGLADVCLALLARADFIEVNGRDTVAGCTALHLAASAGLADVCSALLARPDFTEAGAASGAGATALELAERGGHAGARAALLQHLERAAR